jgi:hypothetical protein
VFFANADAFRKLAELQGMVRIRIEDRPHVIQRCVHLLSWGLWWELPGFF